MAVHVEAEAEQRVDSSDTAMSPEALDLGFAPKPSAGVAAVTAGDEVVLVARDGTSHVLNPTGVVVWQLLDGEATLGDLVDVLDEAFDGDRDVIMDQVLGFAHALARLGLFEGVASTHGHDDDTLSGAVAVGATLEPFTLPDLDGRSVSLDAWRGRRVLLVNWSATCGYCMTAATALAESRARLSERGVDLVLVSRGDADANRRVLDRAGLDAPVLLNGNGVDPFAGFGTPAAYLLGTDGRVAEPMAYGSSEVARLAADLAGTGDAETGDPGPDRDSIEAIEYLPAPRPVCGTGGGGTEALGAAGTRAYRLGAFHVGVAFNSRDAAEILDRLFAGARVSDRRVPDNYSVVLHENAESWPSPLNLLVRGGAQVVRSRSTERTLRALVSYLSAETTPIDPACWNVRAVAVVRDGRAVLLPRGLRGWIKDLAPRFDRHGVVFVDSPFALVDPTKRELIVPDLSVEHDATMLDEVVGDIRRAHDRSFVDPGRYPIVAWHLASEWDEDGLISAGVAVANAYALVRSDDSPASVGRQLVQLFSAVPAYGFAFTSPDDIVRQIEGAPSG